MRRNLATLQVREGRCSLAGLALPNHNHNNTATARASVPPDTRTLRDLLARGRCGCHTHYHKRGGPGKGAPQDTHTIHTFKHTNTNIHTRACADLIVLLLLQLLHSP